MSEDDDYPSVREHVTWTGRAILAVVCLAIVCLATWGIWSGIAGSVAPWQGEVSKRQKVEGNGDYRIAAYDHFHDLCGQVVAKETIIKGFKQDVKDASDPADQSIARANLRAAQNTRTEMINEYNADADKDYTEGQFRDSDLPFHLHEKGTNRCTSSSPSPAP